jgi:hypothetical protein
LPALNAVANISEFGIGGWHGVHPFLSLFVLITSYVFSISHDIRNVYRQNGQFSIFNLKVLGRSAWGLA